MTAREAALKMNGNDAEAVVVRLDHLRPTEQPLEILLDASGTAPRRAPTPHAGDRRSQLEEA